MQPAHGLVAGSDLEVVELELVARGLIRGDVYLGLLLCHDQLLPLVFDRHRLGIAQPGHSPCPGTRPLAHWIYQS